MFTEITQGVSRGEPLNGGRQSPRHSGDIHPPRETPGLLCISKVEFSRYVRQSLGRQSKSDSSAEVLTFEVTRGRCPAGWVGTPRPIILTETAESRVSPRDTLADLHGNPSRLAGVTQTNMLFSLSGNTPQTAVSKPSQTFSTEA
jgi:hypothetical protein